MVAMAVIFIIGLGVANIFPLIFSLTVGKFPLRANEISGLMIMAVSGGAAIPPLIGLLTDNVGLTAGMFVLVVCAVYLLALAFSNLRKEEV
jgi:fucose permease